MMQQDVLLYELLSQKNNRLLTVSEFASLAGISRQRASKAIKEYNVTNHNMNVTNHNIEHIQKVNEHVQMLQNITCNVMNRNIDNVQMLQIITYMLQIITYMLQIVTCNVTNHNICTCSKERKESNKEKKENGTCTNNNNNINLFSLIDNNHDTLTCTEECYVLPDNDLLKERKEKENPKEKEKKESSVSCEYTNDFELFWRVYPRKIGKGAAFRVWNTLKQSKRLPSLDVLIEAVNNQKSSEQWSRDNGQYIPHPRTWLNQHRWLDEIDNDASNFGRYMEGVSEMKYSC